MMAIEYQPHAVLWQGGATRLLPFDVAIAIDDGRIVGRRRVEEAERGRVSAEERPGLRIDSCNVTGYTQT
jgi:hypothetical protein